MVKKLEKSESMTKKFTHELLSQADKYIRSRDSKRKFQSAPKKRKL